MATGRGEQWGSITGSTKQYCGQLLPTSQYRHLSPNGTSTEDSGTEPTMGALHGAQDAVTKSSLSTWKPGGPVPRPGTLPTHHTARSVQVHHTLRQLVKPRQVLWLFFPLTFHQGDASQTERVSGPDGCQGWCVKNVRARYPSSFFPQTLISLRRGRWWGGRWWRCRGGREAARKCLFSSGARFSPN